MIYKKRSGVTTIQTCIIMLISTLVISFFVVFMMNRYQEKLFDISYNTEFIKISNAIDNLVAASVNISITDTIMYSDEELNDYSKTSGEFLKEYIGVYKFCDNDINSCFGKKYTTLAGLEYKPDYSGTCAVLNNGISICLKPQIKDNNITGIMDINGTKSPNILGKDLRIINKKAFKLLR